MKSLHPIPESWVNNPVMEPFATAEGMLQWLRGVDDGYVKGVLSLLNGSLQGLDYRQLDFCPYETGWRQASFEDGRLIIKPFDYLAPASGSRDGLFSTMVEAAKSMHDTTAIGQMGALVLGELQGYRNANKRLARLVYGIAARGFSGTPQDRWDYARAIFNKNPLMDIDFIGAHHMLARTFTAKAVRNSVTDHGWPECIDYEPVYPGVGSPYLGKEMNEFAGYILNQSHFGLPILLGYVSACMDEEERSRCMTNDKTLSANNVIQRLTEKGFRRLSSIDGVTKLIFVHSIIDAYAYGDTDIFDRPIQEMMAPYMPVTPPAHRVGKFATAELVPIFSDYSSRV